MADKSSKKKKEAAKALKGKQAELKKNSADIDDYKI